MIWSSFISATKIKFQHNLNQLNEQQIHFNTTIFCLVLFLLAIFQSLGLDRHLNLKEIELFRFIFHNKKKLHAFILRKFTNWTGFFFHSRREKPSVRQRIRMQFNIYIDICLFVSLLKTKNHLFGNNHFKKCHPEKLGEINIYNSASLHFNVVLII